MKQRDSDMKQDQDPDQEIDPIGDGRVTDALNALGTVEPPAEFVGQVMWRTTHRAAQHRRPQRAARGGGEGLDMAKKALIGLVGVAAVGLVVAYMAGFPPTFGTEGTIGAARRYQAEQIKKSDVKVENPELQAFMQTQAFDKLIHDKQAVAALANPQVAAALMNAQVAAALAAPGVSDALASTAVQQALANPQIYQALAAPGVQQVLAAPGFQALAASQGAPAALAAPGVQQALAANPAFQAALSSPAFQASLANPAFVAALAAPAFQAALAAPGFQAALANPAFQLALNASGFQAALSNPQFAQGLAAQGFVSELSLQAQGLAGGGLAASGAAQEQ
jgi:hypothetical protein